MSAKTELILTKEGIVKRTITDAPVGNVNEILAQAASSVPTDIPSIFASQHGTRVHMRSTRSRITLFCMLKHLVLNTVWRPYGADSKKVFPFGARQQEGDFGATYTWNPYGHERYPKKAGEVPATKEGDMFLYYIFTTVKDGATWKAGENYLIATRKGDKKFYRLPLHNLYEDGRICMGNGYVLEGATLQQRFDNSLKYFEAAPWNTDISAPAEKIQQLFSFSLKGEQLEIPANWHEHSFPVANANFSDLPNLIIT
jgi:hypothetical protein